MKSRYNTQEIQSVIKEYLKRRLIRWQRALSFSALRFKAALNPLSPHPGGPVFIVGTGRSGTHFLCSVLNSIGGLSDYYGGVESPHMFENISDRAFRGEPLGPSQFQYYKTLMSLVYPSLLVDQTHTNLWHVDQLLEVFPEAKIIALSRDVHSVVNSMLSHAGTSYWIDAQQSFAPNEFLGINKKNIDIYKNNLSRIQKFTYRWMAHQRRIDLITKRYPSQVLTVRFERLGSDYLRELERICGFLKIAFEYNNLPEFKKLTLYKQDLLTNADRLQIEQAIDLFNSAI